jgi:carboxyl-terminal processing protease
MNTRLTKLRSGSQAWLACALVLGITPSLASAQDVRVAVRPEAIRQSMPQPTSNYRGGYHHNSHYAPSYQTPVRYDDQTFPANYRPAPSDYSVPNDRPITPVYPGTDVPGSPYGPASPAYGPVSPEPSYGAPTHAEPTIAEKLTYRYTDSRMASFVRSASMSTITSLFQEISQYIDQRHVNPVSYEVRTARALDSLIHAVEHPAFLQAAGASANPAAARQVQAELNRMKTSQPARSAQQSLSVMQYAANLVSRSMGIRSEAVAMEFINGTIDSLDRYSAFTPGASLGRSGAETPHEGVEMANLSENIVGIGVELKAHDDGALIIGVIDGGPAAQAKLQRGDVITAIDGKSLAGMNLNQAADLITGPAGSRLGMQVVRDGRNGNVTLTRQRVYVSSVTNVQMIDPNQKVAYLRLKQFSESSSADLDKALWNLHNQGMKTLVLDLRGNPGGLLDQAILISDKFIAGGNIVGTKGRTAQDNSLEKASYDRTWKVPLVVLVDENSASASEIFAAAIQDNKRGVVVGRNSYGKGTVQTHFPLRSASGDLKLTTAKFYSPSGREMAGSGVRPDVAVPASQAGLEFSPERDGDIQMALRIAQDGRAAQLAAAAGRL